MGWKFLSYEDCLPQCQAPLISMREEGHDLSHPYVPISKRSKNHNVKVTVSLLTASNSSSIFYVMLLSVLRHQKLHGINHTWVSSSFPTSEVPLLLLLLVSFSNESLCLLRKAFQAKYPLPSCKWYRAWKCWPQTNICQGKKFTLPFLCWEFLWKTGPVLGLWAPGAFCMSLGPPGTPNSNCL